MGKNPLPLDTKNTIRYNAPPTHKKKRWRAVPEHQVCPNSKDNLHLI